VKPSEFRAIEESSECMTAASVEAGHDDGRVMVLVAHVAVTEAINHTLTVPVHCFSLCFL
jgi:hypothetical protein